MAEIKRPMNVGNPDFLVTKVAEGLPFTQLQRELTQNGIESADGKVTVRWTFDQDWLAKYGTYKLCIEDTGKGMTREELESGIGDFASSGREQGSDLNFGIGAKIASVASSPAGLLYRTWNAEERNGSTAQLSLVDGRIGLVDLGGGEYIRPLPRRDAPASIRRAGHGTVVTLLGRRLDDDTTLPPAGHDPDHSNSRWVGQALARRYFRFPEHVRVEALETHPGAAVKPRQTRVVHSQKTALDHRARSSGVLDVGDARVHWWILGDRQSDGSSMDLLNLLSGHVGVLWIDELYTLWPYRRRGATLLQNFGISVGGRNVVLYIEPKSNVATANIQRTDVLLRTGGPLPLEEWAEVFVRNMPKPLRDYVNEQAAHATFDRDRLSRRLNDALTSLDIGRYSRAKDGTHRIDPTPEGPDEPVLGGSGGTEGSSSEPVASGKLSSAVAALQGTPARRRDVVVPTVIFCSDRVTDVDNQLVRPLEEFGAGVDRAATYRMSSNTLYVNLDFRAYRAVEEHLAKELLSDHERRLHDDRGTAVVRPHLLDCYVFNLAEAVITVRHLASSGSWPRDEESAALTPEALTLAAMQRASLIPDARQSYRTRR
jgi:hypothetical protein